MILRRTTSFNVKTKDFRIRTKMDSFLDEIESPVTELQAAPAVCIASYLRDSNTHNPLVKLFGFTLLWAVQN